MEEGRIQFESREQLDEMIRGGPCVVCGLHLGNWELVAYTGKLMGAPFTAVYQRLSNPLCRRGDAQAAATALRWPPFAENPGDGAGAPEDGEERRLSGIPCRPPRRQRRPHSIFWRPARSTVFPALLARTTGLPLYAGAAFRRPNVRFTIRVKRIPIPETNDREADAVVADRRYP